MRYSEINAKLIEFSTACTTYREYRDGCAYQAGWFSSMVARLLAELPEEKQQKELEILKKQIEIMEKEHMISIMKS